MGDTSRTTQLTVDLGIEPADISVWNPSGIDIFVDLDIPIDGPGIVHSSPLNVQENLHLTVDIGHGGGGGQETSDAQSERFTRSSQLCTPGHVQERLVSELKGSSAGAERDDGQTSETQCEHYPKGSVEDGGNSSSHTECEITANDLSEVADADTHGNSGSSICASKTSTDRGVNREVSPIPMSDSSELGVEGLDADDVLAACQLVWLSSEDLEEEDEGNYEDEAFEETIAASGLVELSDCIRTDEEEESDEELEDFLPHLSQSMKSSAEANPSDQVLLVRAQDNASTTSG